MSHQLCKICSGQLHDLPLPHENRAILSDGRILEAPLQKVSCLSCGVAAHARPITESQVKSTYDNDYALSTASPLADKARAQAYANILTSKLSPCDQVMEIGCGSGNLLRAMEGRWPASHFFGIDPALPASVLSSEKSQCIRAFFDSTLKNSINEKFGLIFSINVIEHVNSTQDFFDLAAELLLPHGQLAIICPASSPPNLELLFHDHLHTFTPTSLTFIAEKSGFSLVEEIGNLVDLGDFQLIIFRKLNNSTETCTHLQKANGVALAHERSAYLNAWKGLDGQLLTRTSHLSHLSLFGAGQMAALIRAYAPRVWTKIEFLVLDNGVEDAWKLGKPIRIYEEHRDKLKGDYGVIIATSPISQKNLAKRLSRDDILPIRFDDIISN